MSRNTRDSLANFSLNNRTHFSSPPMISKGKSMKDQDFPRVPITQRNTIIGFRLNELPRSSSVGRDSLYPAKNSSSLPTGINVIC